MLQSMLGFKQAIFPEGDYVGNWVADVTRGQTSLYVYCPLVDPRLVGDAQVPLLRIVPVEGKGGQLATRVFDPIQYFPLVQRRFQTVDNQYKGQRRRHRAIRERTRGGDTSL